MSDDWFDRSYRSDDTTPADLDGRILAAARRATRRWTIPVIAAGALTATAATILGILLTQHDLHLAPAKSSLVAPQATERNLSIDLDPAEEGSEVANRQITSKTAPPSGPPQAALPDLRAEIAEAAEDPVVVAPEPDCERSVIIGPLAGGGPELLQLCSSAGLLRIEIIWGGDAPCPSELKVKMEKTDTTPRVTLDNGDLVVGTARYRCEEGDWIAVEEAHEDR